MVADLIRQWDERQTGKERYAGDIYRRTPGLALRRYLQARDRACIMIGCRVPARTADADHTRDRGHRGPTTDDNLGSACRHDHRLKHEGGWRVDQLQPGHFRWTSRLGHSYSRQPPPIMEPLPGSLAPTQPQIPLVVPDDADWEDSEIWSHPPPEPEPEFSPPPATHLGDDLPPF